MEKSTEILQDVQVIEETSDDSKKEHCLCRLYSTIKNGAMYVFSSRVGIFLFRFLPLLATLWTFPDVGLDFNQAKLYYQYAMNGIENCTKDSDFYTISPIYFATSVFILNLPTLMITVLSFCMFGRYGCFNDPQRKGLYKYKGYIVSKPSAVRFCFVVFFIPVFTYIRAIIGYYVFVPIFALYFSIKLALHGEVESAPKIDILGHFYFTPEIVGGSFLMENIGEAAPQIALSITFLVNNSCKHLHSYSLFGIEMPTTIVSLFFSLVSLIIGLIRTMPLTIHFLRTEKETRRTLNNTRRIIDELKSTGKVLR